MMDENESHALDIVRKAHEDTPARLGVVESFQLVLREGKSRIFAQLRWVIAVGFVLTSLFTGVGFWQKGMTAAWSMFKVGLWASGMFLGLYLAVLAVFILILGGVKRAQSEVEVRVHQKEVERLVSESELSGALQIKGKEEQAGALELTDGSAGALSVTREKKEG